MFNLQPGMGLGFEASKQIALGLGTAFLVIVVEIPVSIGTQPADFPYDYYYKRDLIIRDDQEIIELVIIIMKSGMI